MPRKQLPNIAICGVPGTGKSTLAAALLTSLNTLYSSKSPPFRILSGGEEAEKRQCRLAYDDRLQTWEIDEDKLREALQPDLEAGGCIVDWIHADFLVPERDDEDEEIEDHVDLVIQMRVGTETLYDRLKARGYGAKKIDENIDAEIMDEVGEEVRDAFEGERHVVLQGEQDEGERNVARVLQWVAAWREQHVADS